VARVGEYDGFLRDVIWRYKFRRREKLDRPLGFLLAAAIERQPWVADIDAIVPVPTSWRSRFAYSFSPPTSLARQVGRRLNFPLLPLLRERGKKHRQVGIPLAQRIANVRGKYSVQRGARVAGSQLCIIDDVSTSGSTLDEIALVLKKAGATCVYAAVLAKTNLQCTGDHRA
jgi:predicted amidophosphoribosyltransferase